MNKIAVFDLDGTVYRDIITFDVAIDLIDYHNFTEERQRLEEAKHVWKERGSTESYWVYNSTILELFEIILTKVTPQELTESVERVLAQKKSYRYAYTTELIQKLKEEGRVLIAISGSITDMVKPFAELLGFDIIVASDLEIVDGKYTGKRLSQTKAGKAKLLADVVEKHNLTMEDSIAVGDTHRDISMLEVTDHPIAFNPNAALYEEAAKRNWKVVVERKNMVYELVPGSSGYVVEFAHPSHDGQHEEHSR
jgi:HAD superfamily hydrolase (TIGR01490 family)